MYSKTNNNFYLSKYALKPTLFSILAISIILTATASVFNHTYKNLAFDKILIHFILNTLVNAFILIFEILLIYGISIMFKKIVQLNSKKQIVLEFIVSLTAIYAFLIILYTTLIQPITSINNNKSDRILFREYLAVNTIGVLCLYLLFISFQYHFKTVQEQIRSKNIKIRYTEAKIKALNNQINPHFLFNSLSVLTSLVHTNTNQSENFINQLSKTYNYLLEHQDVRLVKLKYELDFIKSYFFLLQIRFGSKIQLELHIEDRFNDYQIPPICLQLLIENAIKHNRMSADHPLIITIQIKDQNIIVKNNLNKRNELQKSTGIGINNIRNRYHLILGKDIAVCDSGTYFEVRLPIIKN
jgi:sensor histidine kinase YesM